MIGLVSGAVLGRRGDKNWSAGEGCNGASWSSQARTNNNLNDVLSRKIIQKSNVVINYSLSLVFTKGKRHSRAGAEARGSRESG